MGRFGQSPAEARASADAANMRASLGLEELGRAVRERVLTYARRLGFGRGQDGGRWATRAQVRLLAQAGGAVFRSLMREGTYEEDCAQLERLTWRWAAWSSSRLAPAQ